MHAVLAHVLSVVKALDHNETNQTKTKKRNRVAESGLHAGANGFLHLREILLELLTSGNDASGKDEGANTEIHERRSEGLSLAETTREDGEIDSKNAAASDDHHGAAVVGDEWLDRERILCLELTILHFLVGILAGLGDGIVVGICGLGPRLQVRSDGREEQETSESLRRVGINGGGAQDGAALQKEVRDESLETVGLEEVLPSL